jgi:hypothetical protein
MGNASSDGESTLPLRKKLNGKPTLTWKFIKNQIDYAADLAESVQAVSGKFGIIRVRACTDKVDCRLGLNVVSFSHLMSAKGGFMPEPFPATPREAILVFHYADRMKAELLLASRLLSALLLLKGEELAGGQKIFLEYLRGLEQEVAFGQSLINDPGLVRVRTVITGLTGMVEGGPLHEIQSHLTWILTTMTTYAQRSMEFLINQGML